MSPTLDDEIEETMCPICGLSDGDDHICDDSHIEDESEL